jgi:hypothetical protein
MEAIQNNAPFRKPGKEEERSFFLKKVRKYYTDFQEIFVRKTQADRRRELFGKDPLANLN